MKYSEGFTVYIDVNTTVGKRYITYTPVDYDQLGSERYVHHGLGSDVTDGQWRTFTRDLVADLQEAQPEVDILEVNGFLIRGSGCVDDIKLASAETPDTCQARHYDIGDDPEFTLDVLRLVSQHVPLTVSCDGDRDYLSFSIGVSDAPPHEPCDKVCFGYSGSNWTAHGWGYDIEYESGYQFGPGYRHVVLIGNDYNSICAGDDPQYCVDVYNDAICLAREISNITGQPCVVDP